MYVSPYVMAGEEKNYIVVDSLTDLILKIDGKEWHPTDSFATNSSVINDTETVGRFATVRQPVRYPFIINVQIPSADLTTAGDYAMLVKNRLNLRPGSYVCQIVSFGIPVAPEVNITVRPAYMWTTLEVMEGHVSACRGEFEVEVR